MVSVPWGLRLVNRMISSLVEVCWRKLGLLPVHGRTGYQRMCRGDRAMVLCIRSDVAEETMI